MSAGIVLFLLLVLIALVFWLGFGRVRKSHLGATAKQPCPKNVFCVTSRDLWPCQAQQNLAALQLSPASICRCLPCTTFPWNELYNTLRLNVDLQQQRLPLFIVRPRNGKDVSRTIKLAQIYKLLLSVKSGGHANEAFSIQNPIVIAIASMNSIHLDECRGILTCGGGCTQGQVFQAISQAEKSFAFPLAHRHHGSSHGLDLAINTGNASDVGLSGILSAGGVGFLQRQLGLTIDSVISFRIALADGSIVKATPTNSYSDLFAATLGSGGGNFGVITEVQLQLHEIADLIVFTISWSDWSQAAAVFGIWQTLAPSFPNNLTQQLYFMIGDGATVPAVSSAGVFIGTDQTQLELLLEPFLSIPTASVIYEKTNFGGQAKKFASGRIYRPFGYRRTEFAFTPLTSAAISTMITQFASALGIPGAHTIEFDPFGGQVAQRPLSSTAFYPRMAQFWLLFVSTWSDQSDTDANLLWLSTIWNAMRPSTSIYCYTGFVMLNLPNFLQCYYGSLLPSLEATKAKYDPNNFFRFPQSIPPG
jgi:FAD/FMN-containing dehydrogenase